MIKSSNEQNAARPGQARPAVGTTLIKRTEFGDKLVAAFTNQDTSRGKSNQ